MDGPSTVPGIEIVRSIMNGDISRAEQLLRLMTPMERFKFQLLIESVHTRVVNATQALDTPDGRTT